MQYEIILKPSAQKDLDSLPDKDVRTISQRIRNLSADPRPVGIQKLSDTEGYRIRSGRYHILFEIHDHRRIIFIYRYRIKHRKEAYR